MDNVCTSENLESCFKSICSRLESYGLPIISYQPGQEKDALLFTLNCIWALIKREKSNVTKLNENLEQISKQNNELKRLNSQIRALENRISTDQEEIGIIKNKFTLAEQEKLKLSSQINILKKENTKLVRASETDRKVYQKNINDQEELIRSLNKNLFLTNELDYQDGKTNINSNSNAKKITSECIQTLDNTIQNLLSEVVSIRSCFMKIFLDLIDLVSDIHSNKCPNDPLIKTTEAEAIFQLPHNQFVETITSNFNIIINYIQNKL